MSKMPSETWSLSPKHTYLYHEPGLDLYDKLPYVRNHDLCNGSHVAMESGNICKFYDCKETRRGYSVPNKDDIFMDLISKQQKETKPADPETVSAKKKN